MRYTHLPAGPRPLAEPDLGVAGANPGAGEVAEKITPPPSRLLPSGGWFSVTEGLKGFGGEPTHRCREARGLGDAHHPGLRVAGNRPAGPHSRLNEE